MSEPHDDVLREFGFRQRQVNRIGEPCYKAGHLLTEQNVYRERRDGRIRIVCRACHAERQKLWCGKNQEAHREANRRYYAKKKAGKVKA